jgi:hypothetical protein
MMHIIKSSSKQAQQLVEQLHTHTPVGQGNYAGSVLAATSSAAVCCANPHQPYYYVHGDVHGEAHGLYMYVLYADAVVWWECEVLTWKSNGTKNEIVKLSSQKGPWEGMTRTVTGAVISTFCSCSLLPEMYLNRRQNPVATALSYLTPVTTVDAHLPAGRSHHRQDIGKDPQV